MRYLLDTGILLRLAHRGDAMHSVVRHAVRSLRAKQHTFCTAAQNIAEFWNASTRPGTVRGGFGLTLEETHRRLRLIERPVTVIMESAASYVEWKSLVLAYRVMGVQVHDARLVALMKVQGITHILTLNADDFRRYREITVVHPRDLFSTEATEAPRT